VKSRSLTILIVGWVVALSCPKVFALLQFNDGGVHDINYKIEDDVWWTTARPECRRRSISCPAVICQMVVTA